MKKFLTLCLAAMMALTSAATVLADNDVMLISAESEVAVEEVVVEEEKEIVDLLVIDDVNAPKTAALYATAFRGGRAVRFIPRQVTITVDAGENGTVDVPAKFFAACTSSRTFNITANEGYEIADILVNGESYGPAYSVKLKNIQVAMDIEVVFAPIAPVVEVVKVEVVEIEAEVEEEVVAEVAVETEATEEDAVVAEVAETEATEEDVAADEAETEATDAE